MKANFLLFLLVATLSVQIQAQTAEPEDERSVVAPIDIVGVFENAVDSLRQKFNDLGEFLLGERTENSNELAREGGFVPPTSFSLFRGVSSSGGDLSDFQFSDDIRAGFRVGFRLNSSEAPAMLIFDSVAPDATSFSLESNAGSIGYEITFEAFNWNTNQFDVIGVASQSFNQDVVNSADLVPADHVAPGGEVRSRLGWRVVGFPINGPQEIRIDQVGWNQ